MLDLFIMSGIQVCTSDGNFMSCAIAMLCSADMPARALISNMKAFNGSYACSTCEDEGTTVPGNKLHRIWPFSGSNILRTRDRIYSAVVTSVQHGQSVSFGASLVCVVTIVYHLCIWIPFSLAFWGIFYACSWIVIYLLSHTHNCKWCEMLCVHSYIISRSNLAYFALVKVKDDHIGLYNFHSDTMIQGISCFGRSSTFSCRQWHGHRLYALRSTGGGKDSTEHMVGLQAPLQRILHREAGLYEN